MGHPFTSKYLKSCGPATPTSVRGGRLYNPLLIAHGAIRCGSSAFSTSFVGVTTRMHTCRFTHVTNAFSSNRDARLRCGVDFMNHYFVRIHKTLMVTTAVAAGVTGQLWETADVVALLPDEDAT